MSTDGLQLKRVVLYKSGLGFFEKRGSIDLAKEKSLNISFRNNPIKTWATYVESSHS